VNGSRKVVPMPDDGPVHHLKAVLGHAEESDVRFVYLPPYRPQFNPIKLVWKSMKRVVSSMFILERHQLIDVVRESFMEETSKTSYLDGWMKTFLIDHDSKKLGS
ncbi:MAG: transposase, partial [Candidatus Methanomethylophilaceae archaeon]|nr:transposase [Candidatus Methanomethylophilaceae archaeon]